ncbi:hypothetical protein LTR10_020565 [Elasticomyces elasticus]|uniref:MAPEG family protein n=1 Tax=Exophiala sideris TaxID=1016849 RepID=A0ABR0JK32_9EURO|nr:hypothetical protein LTR10_020565 [Elasticomyces elasticus]KAK5035418.1 hypothetical protein LTS07_002856 [Exophiala sideris]KAK5039230.1 hypothetical protein LTR13_003486 [Exophiala sideris]KAK5066343.1 hypothetical protein LTR69_002862 [Exophiala sideris]KAK5187020.1 hypothetical protein LTR44_001027 [Eurotiomycetes sp. CCFEE 6388]
MSSSSSNPSTPNAIPYLSTRAFALHAIPISYALAYPPHLYFFTKLMSATGFKASNMTPRLNLSALSASLPKATTDMLWRARGCHLNAIEGFPLFAAAMLAGTYTNLDARQMNVCAAEYLAARVVYSVLYMTVKSEKASYLRSAVYFYSVGIPFYVLWKAGWKMAATEKRAL